MNTHTTDKLIFNFGFLLDGALGESTEVVLDYPTVKLDDLLLTPLTGKFFAARTAQGLYIKGHLQTNVKSPCARCVNSFLQAVAIELDEHYYLPGSRPSADSLTIKKNGRLNLGPLVRELSLVSVPMQPICKLDCEGLCIECGQNLNEADCGCDPEEIDPRLAILKNLLEN